MHNYFFFYICMLFDMSLENHYAHVCVSTFFGEVLSIVCQLVMSQMSDLALSNLKMENLLFLAQS